MVRAAGVVRETRDGDGEETTAGEGVVRVVRVVVGPVVVLALLVDRSRGSAAGAASSSSSRAGLAVVAVVRGRRVVVVRLARGVGVVAVADAGAVAPGVVLLVAPQGVREAGGRAVVAAVVVALGGVVVVPGGLSVTTVVALGMVALGVVRLVARVGVVSRGMSVAGSVLLLISLKQSAARVARSSRVVRRPASGMVRRPAASVVRRPAVVREAAAGVVVPSAGRVRESRVRNGCVGVLLLRRSCSGSLERGGCRQHSNE